MSDALYTAIGILLFALATSILYIIGMKRKMTQDMRLFRMLLNNGARRTLAYLKTHDKVTAKGIGYLAQEVKAKEFMSAKKAIITDGKAFQDQLIDFMLKGNYIEECGMEKGEKLYCLPKKEDRK